MLDVEFASEPILLPVKIGWSAHGDGWAVHAPTREEVIQRFRERIALYHQIDRRSYSNVLRDDDDSTMRSNA